VHYRLLGRSGLKVSSLGLGTISFGSRGKYLRAGHADAGAATRQLDIALDAGVNLIDTADVYSEGAGETVVGEILRGRRDRVVLATKLRMAVGDGPNDEGLSRYHVIRACEASLQRLGTDHIDLLQVHAWDGQTPLEETLEALDTLVRSGKVRYLGCSNYSAWHLMKALATSDRHGYQRFVSQQVHYTLVAREVEHELIPAGIDQGVGVVVWSPLAGGLLTGKPRAGGAGDGARTWPLPPVPNAGRLQRVLDALTAIAARHDCTAAEIGLAWLLTRPGVTSVLVGARTESQLTTNLRAVSVRLAPEDVAHLDQESAVPFPYPYWHQARSASRRLGSADLALHRAALVTEEPPCNPAPPTPGGASSSKPHLEDRS
jgi:aryl-alcohol dehydrogenase-like predicted oxidoreductase